MLFLTFFLACDTIESQLNLTSPEEQLIDLRFEYKSNMDALYQSYGGNEIIENINANVDDASSNIQHNTDNDSQASQQVARQLMSTLKNTVSTQDRLQFEQDCLQIGNGHNVPFVTTKASTFFSQPTTIEGCKKAALQQIKIQQIESELQSPAAKPLTPDE